MIAWLKNAFDFIGTLLRSIGSVVKGHFVILFGFIGVFIATPLERLFNWMADGVDVVGQKLDQVADAVDALGIGQLPAAWSGISYYAGLAANWFPMDLAISCFMGLCVLWVICLGIRIVRTWIPVLK